VQKIKTASDLFIETEKLKREKAYQGWDSVMAIKSQSQCDSITDKSLFTLFSSLSEEQWNRETVSNGPGGDRVEALQTQRCELQYTSLTIYTHTHTVKSVYIWTQAQLSELCMPPE